jgi:hypothetical protein
MVIGSQINTYIYKSCDLDVPVYKLSIPLEKCRHIRVSKK